MAARSWAGSTVSAIGIAAMAGAAQLGVGYGLGIVAWVPAQDQASKVIWQASLAWVVWVAATSTVLGAIAAHWLHGGSGPGEREGFVFTAWRATIALAAAVGALVTVPLVGIPARAAESPQNFAPEWTAAGYVGVGVIVGLAIAVAALFVRAIAANVIVSLLYLWTLAVFAVVDGLREAAVARADEATVARADEAAEGIQPLLIQLAIWRFSDGPTVRDFYVPGVLLMLAAAAVIGLFAAWPAGRRGDNRLWVGISGAAGPLLVAAAYLLAAPQFVGNTDIDVSQWSAHLFAPYAVLAGVAGSVVVAAIGPPESPAEKQERLARTAERRTAREEERRAAREAREARKSRGGPDRAPVGAQPTDDELRDWPSTLDKETSSVGTVSTAKRPARADDPGPPGEPRHPDADLEDDAYAPARAYRGRPGADPDAKAYASDTADPKPAPSQPAPGRDTSAPTPLWPSSPGAATRPDSGTGDAAPGKGRRRPKR